MRLLAAGGAVLVGGWLGLRALAGALRRVRGDSMRPALRDGDVVLTRPVHAAEVAAGQVVVVRDPRVPARRTVKRVEATAGAWADLPDGPGRVAGGRIAVRGDDPARSSDSRTYGAVAVDLVERRVVARVWPLPPRPVR